MSDHEGTLIAIEGIDGSGKGTLIEKLKHHYSGEDFLFTKEPSNGVYGQIIRNGLRNGEDPSPSDFFLFLADRVDHCRNVIQPALEEGKTVVTDRYDLSTYAYQSKILDEELNIIDPMQYIDEMTYHFTIEPDAYIYMQISAEEALSRINGKESYEDQKRLEEASRIYDHMADTKDNVVVIPSQWGKESIFMEAATAIDTYRGD